MAEKPSSDTDLTPALARPTKGTPLAPGSPQRVPSAMGSTFAERKQAREEAEAKAIKASAAEDKAVAKKATADK